MGYRYFVNNKKATLNICLLVLSVIKIKLFSNIINTKIVLIILKQF